MMDLAIGLDIVQKSGSWFSYEGQKVAQGKDNTRAYFEKNPELMKELEEKIITKIKNGEVASDEEFEIDTDDFDISSLNLD